MTNEFIDTYLKLIEFYRDNTNVIVPNDSETSINTSDIVLTDNTKTLDSNLRNVAIDTKLKTLDFFNNVIDQQAFKNTDYNRLRKFIVDWYSANQALLTLKLSSSDLFSLTDDLLDIAFKSFGYEYSNLIFDKNTKVQFLLALTELYKKKGTPQALVDVLKFYGFSDVTVYEWWLKLNSAKDDLEFEGRLLDTGSTLTEFPEKRSITYNQFSAINDPHWNYTRDEILNLQSQYDQQGLIGLPSLTPYFSISGGSNLRSITQNFAILSRMLDDQYNNWLYGNNVPKDLFIDAYGGNVSLISLYSGILYSYHRYNDYVKFISLRDYIYDQFPNIPLDSEFTFSQPYTYEKLLLWAITRTDKNGNPQYLDLQAVTYTDDTSIIEYTPTTGGWLRPKENIPFNLYPPVIERYGWFEEISEDLEDSFNFDTSLNLFDQAYSTVGITSEIEEFLKYLYAQDFTDGDGVEHEMPNYNVAINTITDLEEKIQPFLNSFEEIATRPQTYDEAKEKLETFFSNFTELQKLDFIQNVKDPKRVLNGLGRINPGDSYPSANSGDQLLITGTDSSDPYIQEYNGSSWSTVNNGISKGNLGLDKTFLTWIDSEVGTNYFEYISVVSILLNELDTFFASYIQRLPISSSQLLSGSKLAEDLLPVINFWTPYKARFLSFELLGTIAEPVKDSAMQKDEIEIEVWERDDINGTHYRQHDDGSTKLYRKLDKSEWHTGGPS